MREAGAEFAATRSLYGAGHRAWGCFTCQQAAENALKVVCEHLRMPQAGHNLNLLVEAVAAQVAVPDPVGSACRRLNRLYVPARYPNAFDQGVPAEQFSEEDAQLAVGDVEEVLRVARETLGSA